MNSGCCWTGKRLVLLCAVVVACFCACAGGGVAQAPVTEGSTIHVYTNLLQIPVLILDSRHQPLPPIPPASFTVQLGKDEPFHPKLVRHQGEDPITLAILLDGSQHGTLMPSLLDSLPLMAGRQLSKRDRIALYAMDGCKFRRFLLLVPADESVVRTGVERALAFPPYAATKGGTARCDQPIGLWDAVDYVTRSLAGEPGRRVVLAVTNGNDLGSRVLPSTLRTDANHTGVTIFAIAERHKVPMMGPVRPFTPAGWNLNSSLAEVSEGSGGMVIESTRNNLPYTFSHFVELLRGRYIVEFTRPAGLVGGTSLISVTCGQPRAFIRAAGTSLPIADPVAREAAVLHGPASAVVPDQAKAPASSRDMEPPSR